MAIMQNSNEDSVSQEVLSERFSEEPTAARSLIGWQRWAVGTIALAFSIFQLAAVTVGGIGTFHLRVAHLTFGLVLIFLLYSGRGKTRSARFTVSDVILGIIAVACGAYLLHQYVGLAYRTGAPTTVDLVIGGALLIVVLEACRRVIGWTLLLVTMAFLLYAKYGFVVPGILGHGGLTNSRIIASSSLGLEGLFGIPLGVSATHVFIFVLFGAFLFEFGGGRFFMAIAQAATGRLVAGPAKASIVASALFGSISGSTVANVVTTGVITIPLMRRMGFRPAYAGAVEAAASTGGQIMPPVMGAAAFIMAEYLNVPYSTIVIAAIIPAALYFTSLLFAVHLQARVRGLDSVSANTAAAQPLRQVLREGWYHLLPLITLIYALVILRMSPMLAALWAICLVVVLGQIGKETRFRAGPILRALENGARQALPIIVATGVAGVIVGLMSISGGGPKLSFLLVDVAGDRLLVLLLLAMVAAIILGMGLPTSAVYILLATLVAPAMVRFGVDPMAAHMFILYFGVMANVTPPIAMAAYAGAMVAGANMNRTSLIALRLALVGFVVPFVFAFQPSMLFEGSVLSTIWVTGTALLGVFALTVALQGFYRHSLNLVERIIVGASGVSLIAPSITAAIVGASLLVLSTQLVSRRKTEGRKTEVITSPTTDD